MRNSETQFKSSQGSSWLLEEVEGVKVRLKWKAGEEGTAFSMSIKLNLLLEILLAIKPRID